MRPYSMDLRKRVADAYEAGEGSMRELAKRYNVSLAFVRDLLKRYRQTGSLEPRPPGGGYPRAIKSEHEPLLLELLEEHNDLILVEMVELLRERHGVQASRASAARALKRMGVTRKKRASTRPNANENASGSPERDTDGG